MSWRNFTLAALCVVAAFALFWFHRDGGAMFLTLIGGSPLAAEGMKKAGEAISATTTSTDQGATATVEAKE